MEKVFFDIHNGSEFFGKIVIEVDETNLFAKNFTELCIGSKGPSYIGTLLWRSDNYVGMVGGMTLEGVPHLVMISESEKNSLEKVICKERDVYVLDHSYSAFLLATQNHSNLSYFKIGKMVEGYELIKEKHGLEINFTISDCGVILENYQ